MSKQTINIGASPNDGTGTPLRTSFDYTNQNFTEIYTALGGGVALPGATTQVIFNDGGTNLAGDAGLVYNKTTDALTVAGLVTAGSATITGDLTVDTSTLKVDSTNNRVGIGTATPNYILDVLGSSPRFHIKDNGTGTSLLDIENGAGTLYVGRENSTGSGGLSGVPYAGIMYLQGAYPLIFGTNFVERYRIDATGVATWSVAGSTAMTLNSTGLGIGAVPSTLLFVQKSQSADTTLVVSNENAGTAATARLDLRSNVSNYLTLQSFGENYSGNVCGIAAAKLNTVLDNALTANSSGLLIGTVSTNPLYFVTANAVKMTLDASGNLLVASGVVRAAGRTQIGSGYVGDISGTGNNRGIFIGSTGLLPSDGSGNVSDNTYDLGDASNRWDTVFAGTGTINTSDRNDKQDIADLSASEKRVASSIKQLVKKYRFKDAVASKGENARIHVGWIAQDIQSAFAAEGLDASKYGVFCSDTWYEVNGSSVDSDKKPYTTESENAVAKTRLGLRHDELLAFVVSNL